MAMNLRQICVNLFVLGATVACSAVPSHAQPTTNWTGNVDTDFFNDGNWDNGAPNTEFDVGGIDSADVNQVAIIDASTGAVTLDGMDLGFFVGGGNVIQNGGVLTFDAFTETTIGGDGANTSSWIMNNDSMILYDGPLTGGGGGYGLDGLRSADFDVGNGASVATLELHDTAILRIADDLKISDNGTALGGHVLLDGNAQITAGSGTSIGSNGPSTLTIAENALYVSGNSAGPGNSAEGYTNEGYLTMHETDIVVRDNGRLWIRTLQHRGGEANVTIQDNARFDIFDVFFNDSPDLGVATVKGSVSGNERTSHISQNPGDNATITIKGNGAMTVDSDVPDSTWSGLAISGGNNSGGTGTGGESTIDVQDQGSFTVQQDLNMTLGTDVSAKSTLKVRGPEATVAINGDLRMALDPDGFVNPGAAILHSVITAETHSTIQVGGNVNIDNGDLVVELDGFYPRGGESYELIAAGSVTGTDFKSEDFTLATLVPQMEWDVDVVGTSVFLNVLGFASDFNQDDVVNGDDFLIWQNGFLMDDRGDANGDGVTDGNDFLIWQTQFSPGNGAASAAVPEPTSVMLVILGCLTIGWRARRRGSN